MGAMGAAVGSASTAFTASQEILYGASMGAVAGTVGGATAGYAGGKGSIQNIVFKAALGNITGAALGAIGGALKAANSSEHAVNKVADPRADKLASGAKSKLALKLKEMRMDLKVDQSFDIAMNDMNTGKAVGGLPSAIKAPLDKMGNLKLQYQIYGAAQNYVTSGKDISNGITIIINSTGKEVTTVYPGSVDIISENEKAFWIHSDVLREMR